jgi:SAM-dependent methyltransferase
MLARQDGTVASDTPSKQAHANSFGPATQVYEAARPGYPAEAVTWLVPAGARRVLDIGAGTGKFTRMLHADGRTVVAVDPSVQMLEVLHEKVPGVEALVGTAEELPLADADVDAVTLAQAWHWVDEERGVPEIARVLRPGGTLGLIWNSRDERVDWVRELGEAMGSNESITPASLDELAIGAPFEPGEVSEFACPQTLSRVELIALVRSRSHFLVKDETQQAAVLRKVEAVLDRHPGVERDGAIELPYVTRAFRFRRG